MKKLLFVVPIMLMTACSSTPEGKAATECWNEGFTSSPGYDTCFAKKMEAHNLAIRKQQQDADATLCKEYGFKKNTDAFANCMMNLEQSRLQRDHETELQKKRSDRHVTYIQKQTSPPRPIQCHKESIGAGLWTTNCY